MGVARKKRYVNLFAGLITADMEIAKKARSCLERRFGPVSYESPVLDFDHTAYYTAEMGAGLKRVFYFFGRKCGIDGLHRVKMTTNAMEGRFLKDGKRSVNIDPGYLDLSKVVLFTTKDYSHRTHVGGGIFAEVTLYFRDGSYRPWPWTYPDYRTDEYLGIFNRCRGLLCKTA